MTGTRHSGRCSESAVRHGPRFSWAQRSVLTIHNIGYQGVFNATAISDVGLGSKSYLLHQDDLRAESSIPPATALCTPMPSLQ